MLLIGTPVRVKNDTARDLLRSYELPEGYVGHISEVELGATWNITVIFSTMFPGENQFLELDMGSHEIEVLSEDICTCHFLRGEQRENGTCPACG